MSEPRDLVHQMPEKLLKAATKRLVKAVGNGEGAAATIAEALGRPVRQQHMSDCGLAGTPHFLRIDEVGALEDVTAGLPGHPHVTRALAHRQGLELVPIPQAPAGVTDFHRAMAGVSKETSEIIERLCTALADQKVEAREVVELRLREEVADAQARLAELDALLRAVVERGDG
jgi:hypothetical protein